MTDWTNSMTFTLSSEALAQHIFIGGKTGSGKSNAAKVIAEQLMRAGERVCAIDPTGTWWGLRLDRDGKHKSHFAPVIFGGQHADLAVGEAHGAAIGETIGTSSTSAIIDTRLMTVAARTRFFTDFAEALLRTNRGNLHLIIDEAHLFMPQAGAKVGGAAPAMLHAGNNLVSLGRGVGLSIIMISQRPAKVHKDALTQAETLIAMRVIHPLDRKAIDDWIGEWASPADGKELVSTLAGLPQGDAWVWSPELGILTRAHFPLASTFDSGRPRADEDVGPLAPIDINAIATRLETVGKEVLANDPATLRREIVALRKQVADQHKQGGPTEADLKEAEERGFARGLASGIDRMLSTAMDAVANVRVSMLEAADRASDAVRKAAMMERAGGEHTAQAVSSRPVAQRPPQPKPTSAPVRQPLVEQLPAEGLTGPQATILKALAWWRAMGHAKPSRPQIAGIAGWKITSGHLKNVIGSLRTAGLITYPDNGRVELTPEGAAVAPEPDLSVTLVDGVRSVLSGPQQQIFDTLLRVGGGPMERGEIASSIGWDPTSGHLKNVIGSLRTLELVTYPEKGQVALQDWVTG